MARLRGAIKAWQQPQETVCLIKTLITINRELVGCFRVNLNFADNTTGSLMTAVVRCLGNCSLKTPLWIAAGPLRSSRNQSLLEERRMTPVRRRHHRVHATWIRIFANIWSEFCSVVKSWAPCRKRFAFHWVRCCSFVAMLLYFIRV